MNEITITTEAELAKVMHTNPVLADRHLGDILINEGQLNEEQLQQALAWQQQHPGIHIGDVLIELEFCSREQVNAAMASKLGIP
mgnify:CR=1 FL=1